MKTRPAALYSEKIGQVFIQINIWSGIFYLFQQSTSAGPVCSLCITAFTGLFTSRDQRSTRAAGIFIAAGIVRVFPIMTEQHERGSTTAARAGIGQWYTALDDLKLRPDVKAGPTMMRVSAESIRLAYVPPFIDSIFFTRFHRKSLLHWACLAIRLRSRGNPGTTRSVRSGLMRILCGEYPNGFKGFMFGPTHHNSGPSPVFLFHGLPAGPLNVSQIWGIPEHPGPFLPVSCRSGRRTSIQ